jgi:hypothetical protein
MEFKEKIRTINVSKVSVAPIYKKLDKVLEGIQYDKDRYDAAQQRMPKMMNTQSKDLFMQSANRLPREFVDHIRREMKDMPKPDLNSDIPKDSLFNFKVNPAQAPAIEIMPEDLNRIRYSVENAK